MAEEVAATVAAIAANRIASGCPLRRKAGGSWTPKRANRDAELAVGQDTFPSVATLREQLGEGSHRFLFLCPEIPKP